MKFFSACLISTSVLAAAAMFTGCASTRPSYEGAFNTRNAPANNQRVFSEPSEVIFALSKQIFVRQGFTVDYADASSGVIKAVRNMNEAEDDEISYNIQASVDVSKLLTETNISLSASQQTILHKSDQTLVTSEGMISSPDFYSDFFAALTAASVKYDRVLKIAAEKAEAEKAVVEAAAAEKAAAQKIEDDRIKEAKAAAERIEAEKANKVRAAADARAAAEKAQLERAITERAVAAAKEAMRIEEETKQAEALAKAAAAKKAKKVVKKTTTPPAVPATAGPAGVQH